MNLQDLMLKMKAIEEGKDVSVEECGDMPMPAAIMHAEPQKQPDNVTMNISMNGQGAGGIKDLMDIIRSIEKGGSDHDEPLMGEPSEKHSHEEPLMGDEKDFEEAVDDAQTFANSPHGTSGTQVKGIDAVTATGDDMNSKGKMNPHYSPGNNTLRQSTTVHEGLVEKLQAHYEEVKTRDLKESTLTDHTGHTLTHILNTYKREVKDFQEGGDLNEHLFDALYDYYFDEMPYGVKKARDGDPFEWVSERLAQELGINECPETPVVMGAGAGD